MAEQMVIDPDNSAAIELIAAEYFVSPKADAESLIRDTVSALEGATEMVSLLASELGEEGSQAQADPASASRILWGVYQLLKVARGAAAGAESALYRAHRPEGSLEGGRVS